jgi:UDP-N-acetylmuramoyl-L-alanyl-D-glutamate--2,6-diaminopimelate ligase
MKAGELFQGIAVIASDITGEEEITGIAYHSGAVRPGNLFAALKGAERDGLDFIAEAEANGAAACLSAWPKPPSTGLRWVQVADAREALALASANFYGHPSERLKTVGVTGTKGKTTVTYLLEAVVGEAGGVPGVVGTIEYRRPGLRHQAARTTPESTDLQRMMAEMLAAGVTHCIMEVSSHALSQKRVWGISFDVAVFTNLSGEHLDFHGTMEDYFEAKKKLFFLNHKRNASVVNIDDPWGQKLISELPMKTITFGFEPAAIVRAAKPVMSEKGLEFQVVSPGSTMSIQTGLVGKYNIYNILAAVSAALAMNIPAQAIVQGIKSLRAIPGRFEKVPNGRGLLIVVDYAHTDSALEHLLVTAREFKPRRVILVFGAGGNRDKAKRERMGRVAARFADRTIITSDNPRNEDPLEIIAAIESGFVKENSDAYEKVPDRRQAIARALSLAERGDAVLVAGKGHEDYQIFKDRTIHFSDVETIREILESGEKA